MTNQRIPAKTTKLLNYHKVITKLLTSELYTEPPAFHYEILERYNNDDRLQLTVAPVGFAKSATIKTFALYQLLRTKNADKFILYVSSTATKVAGQFTAIAKILNSPQMRTLREYKVIENNQNALTIEFKNGERRRINGVASGQDISGINFEGFRPSLIVIDDLEELDSAKSSYLTEKLIDWLNTTLKSRLPSLLEGRIRMIGTNLTKNSIVNRILNNQPNARGESGFREWHSYRYQAIDQSTNQSIWENRHPLAALLKEQELNPYSFAANYQNEPLDIASGLIKYEDLRFYEPSALQSEPTAEGIVKPKLDLCIHADTTHTGKQTSDYFCITGIAKNAQNYYDLVDFKLAKMDPEAQARAAILFYDKMLKLGYNVVRMSFDAVSNDGFGYWIKKLAREEYNISLPIVGHKITRDKVAHLMTHLSLFKSNSVRFPAQHPQLQLLLDQVLAFPATGVHDDAVDGLTGCLDGFIEEATIAPSMTIF